MSTTSVPTSSSPSATRETAAKGHIGRVVLASIAAGLALLRGIGVHVAARVMAEARGGEVLVSDTVPVRATQTPLGAGAACSRSRLRRRSSTAARRKAPPV